MNIEIEDRLYLTKKDRRIEDIELLAANKIIDETIEREGKNINLWKRNVMQYVTAITLLAKHGKLREKKVIYKEKKTDGWILNNENKINAIRRKLSHVNLILNNKDPKELTPRQHHIKRRLKKMYGSSKRTRLIEVQARLKHDLRVQCSILRNRKTIVECQRINSLFDNSVKTVYREFRREKKIEVKNPPPKEETKSFWSNIWSQEGRFNTEAEWLPKLREGYCREVRTTITNIKYEHFNEVTDKLKHGNSPGRDLIVGYWIKKTTSLRKLTIDIYNRISNNEEIIPEWLIRARTTLIAKNDNTHETKNYRPIACKNVMMKVCTGCLAKLIEQHCNENNIIYPEQAGAKKGMWGCIDQLLINKVVSEKVRKYHRNLVTIWLDYKKAYDSIPHEWIIETLQLAKVPDRIITAVANIMKAWKTELNLPTSDKTIYIGEILYRKGLLQGDYLSVILFIPSLNPCSYLLNETEG